MKTCACNRKINLAPRHSKWSSLLSRVHYITNLLSVSLFLSASIVWNPRKALERVKLEIQELESWSLPLRDGGFLS